VPTNIFGSLTIGTFPNQYVLPSVRGSAGFVLTSDGVGSTIWAPPRCVTIPFGANVSAGLVERWLFANGIGMNVATTSPRNGFETAVVPFTGHITLIAFSTFTGNNTTGLNLYVNGAATNLILPSQTGIITVNLPVNAGDLISLSCPVVGTNPSNLNVQLYVVG
jgi:hypothetical protein